jgi:carbon storage regulator
MLILTRKESERIYLGDHIVLTVVRIGADKVRIGVEAPSNVRVLRLELSEPDFQVPLEGQLDRKRTSQGRTSDGRHSQRRQEPGRQDPGRQEPRRRAA